ncbi:MAG: Amuc_1100 family pilus-like protein [Verrucomicrobiales bacterium]
MDDIKKNPFLSAYTALLVIAAGVLGFFAYKAYSGYNEATSAYKSVRGSVDSLKGQDFYPNEKNKAARTAEVEEFTKQVAKLEAQLAPFQPERTENLTVPELQLMIRKNIEEVRENANLSGVTIVDSDGFRLGMAGPLTFAPRADAVPGLEFQLIAARQLADLLISSGIDSIDEMGREELSVEKPPVIVDSKKKTKPKKGPVKKEPLLKEDEVIERYPLTAIFTGDMASVRTVLNNLAATPEGSVFFSTRFLRLENEKKEGPDKEGDEKPLDGDEEGADNVSVILGNESLKMQLVVDAIRFVSREEAEAAAAAAKEAAKKKKSDA